MRDVLLFTIEGKRFALPLETVRQVALMAEISPVPGGQAGIAGLVNVHGEALPVVDLRRHWQFPPRPFFPSDHLLIVDAGRRMVALAVDAAEGVGRLREEAVEELVEDAGYPTAVATIEGELVLLVDPARAIPAFDLPFRGAADVADA